MAGRLQEAVDFDEAIVANPKTDFSRPIGDTCPGGEDYSIGSDGASIFADDGVSLKLLYLVISENLDIPSSLFLPVILAHLVVVLFQHTIVGGDYLNFQTGCLVRLDSKMRMYAMLSGEGELYTGGPTADDYQ